MYKVMRYHWCKNYSTEAEAK